MVKCAVIGASGYTGAELVNLLNQDANFELTSLWVSEQSDFLGKRFDEVYPKYWSELTLSFQALSLGVIDEIAANNDAVFLCLDHRVSLDLVPQFLDKGLDVFDLSGAYRLKEPTLYDEFYGFKHEYPALLDQAVYGLVGWNDAQFEEAQLIAVPGCYPTAAALALLPLVKQGLLDTKVKPIINAISGISGAGKKPSMKNSFCELSVQAYGLFDHRHRPELEQTLALPVVFTPHLGNFARGIFATIYTQVHETTSSEDIDAAFQVYDQHSSIFAVGQTPALNDVVYTNKCHLYWQKKGNEVLVLSAIDNLLKGAAGQAVECANIKYKFKPSN